MTTAFTARIANTILWAFLLSGCEQNPGGEARRSATPDTGATTRPPARAEKASADAGRASPNPPATPETEPAVGETPEAGVEAETERAVGETPDADVETEKGPEDERVAEVLARLRAAKAADGAPPALSGSQWAFGVSKAIRKSFAVPDTIAGPELAKLRCKVDVQVGADLVPVKAAIAEKGSSGNKAFDAAVVASLEKMRAHKISLPEPPAPLRAALSGRGLLLTVRGRDLQ